MQKATNEYKSISYSIEAKVLFLLYVYRLGASGSIQFSCLEFIFNLPNILIYHDKFIYIYVEKCKFSTNCRKVYLKFWAWKHEEEKRNNNIVVAIAVGI